MSANYPLMSDTVQAYVKANRPNVNPCYELAGVLLAMELAIAEVLDPADPPPVKLDHWRLMLKDITAMRHDWETIARATLE